MSERVVTLDVAERGLRVGAGASSLRAKVAIIASGARLRRLDVPGAAELAGRGVSYCDWCDGGLYRGQHVAVVGGGCAAVQAALHLAEMCESVTIVARSSTLRARRDSVLRAADNERIAFQWDCEAQAVLGEQAVEGLRLRALGNGETFDVPCSGVFVFAGLVPDTGFVAAPLARDPQGFVMTDAHYLTSIPGVFAAGTVRSGSRGPVVVAMAEAHSAAIAAVEAVERADAS